MSASHLTDNDVEPSVNDWLAEVSDVTGRELDKPISSAGGPVLGRRSAERNVVFAVDIVMFRTLCSSYPRS
jgi:hypothetical protein